MKNRLANHWGRRSGVYTDQMISTVYGGGIPFIAVRIVDKYQHRLPTRDELMNEWGMSRATACRWIRAIKDARGLP